MRAIASTTVRLAFEEGERPRGVAHVRERGELVPREIEVNYLVWTSDDRTTVALHGLAVRRDGTLSQRLVAGRTKHFPDLPMTVLAELQAAIEDHRRNL